MKRFTITREVQFPYGLAEGEEARKIVGCYKLYINEFHPGCPTLEGKIWVKDDELVGSTPHAKNVLANSVVTGDFAKELGAHVATPQEIAQMVNDEKERAEENPPGDKFFRDTFWFHSGLWITNPFAVYDFDKLQTEGNVWNHILAQSVLGVMEEKRVFAFPESAVVYERSVRGQIPIGVLNPNKKDSVVLLDWTEEDANNGFNYHNFDVREGVPEKGSIGTRMSRFYGLRGDRPVSALYVCSDLDAGGNWGFDGSYGGARVVFNVDEVNAQKSAV